AQGIQGEKGEGAAALHNGTLGLEFWPLNDGNFAVATGTTTLLDKVVIPSTYNGKEVTRIRTIGGNHVGGLKEVVVPTSIQFIEEHAVWSGTTIRFEGTIAQWKQIAKEAFWVHDYGDMGKATVICTDGQLEEVSGGNTGNGGNDGNGGNGGNGGAQNENEVYDAEIKNLNGHEVRFIVSHNNASHLSVNEVYAESPNGDKVNDAVFARNAQIANEYNCKIVENRYEDVAKSIREPLIAGEYVADIILNNAKNSRSLAAANLLADLSNLDNINLEKVWYDQNSMTGLNIGGKVFFVNGDGTTLDDRAAQIMFVNKDWVEGYDSSLNLYDVVKEGRWTIDLMVEIMNGTAKDLDGDGAINPGTDRLGYVADADMNWFHVAAGGVTLSRVSSTGDYEIPAQPKPELLEAWEAVRPLLTSPCREVSDNSARLRNGFSTFYAGNLGNILYSGQTTQALGVLPLPKLDKDQDKYYTGVDFAKLGAFCIPTTVDNCEDWETNGFTSGREQAAYILEAFSYYSKLTLTPAFYDQVILKLSIRDTESAEMVKIALENKIYDPVVGYNFGGMYKIFEECGSPVEKGSVGSDEKYDTFVSTYTGRYSAARKALQDYLTYTNTEI
ncbi:MAG: hypothetical protein IKU24_05405, partial [Clostridia bacterium]|nr:hypothetical protein [Clostridia bacterium]